MTAAEHDRRRLDTLLVRLAALELRLVLPHERPIAAVAHEALCAEIHALVRRLDACNYWHRARPAGSAATGGRAPAARTAATRTAATPATARRVPA